MKLTLRIFSLTIVTALVSWLAFAAQNVLTPVNAKHICFITKKRYERTLKFVVVDGKKYYGSTAECLEQLKNDPASRMAVDPVSGKQVDKAAAVLGEDRNGNVYFFENQENMKKFRAPEAIPTGER